MNKIRIIGLVMLTIAINLHFTFDNDGIDFIAGALLGGGVILIITEQLKSKKSKS